MTEIEQAVEETAGQGTDRYFYVILAVIVIVFAGFFLLQRLEPPVGSVVTVSGLQGENLNGSLSEEEGYLYNGFSFVLFDGLWYTTVSRGNTDYQIPLHFGPRDLQNVTMNGSLSDAFNEGTDIYIAVDPLDSGQDFIALAASELAQNMATAIKRRPVGACLQNETSMCASRPIRTCGSTEHALIELRQEAGPSVEFHGTCMILRGERYDLVKAVDRLLLAWYGVQ